MLEAGQLEPQILANISWAVQVSFISAYNFNREEGCLSFVAKASVLLF